MNNLNQVYSSSPVAVPPPPPPAKKKSGARVWIGLFGAFLVLCCCAALLIIGYTYRTSIPVVSEFFATPTFTPSPTPTATLTPTPSPTSSGISYHSTSLNLSLTYPIGWAYDEEYPLLALAADEEAFTSNAPMQTFTLVMIFRQTAAAWEFPASVNTNSPTAIVNYFIDSIPCGQVLWNTRTFQVDSEAAASFACLVTQNTPNYVTYLVAIVPSDSVMIIIGFSPADIWNQNLPIFEGIVNGIRIDPF
ncbi:MAG: hypothetical protein ABWK53_12505 [Anaerolineales bacterium]